MKPLLVALLLLLPGCFQSTPKLAQCCIDPGIPETCDRQVYKRDGSTIAVAGQCPRAEK